VRWRRVDNPDVIDRRSAGGAGGMRLPIPTGRGGRIGGGIGLVGVLLYVAIQLLGGGAFDVETGFGGGIEAPGQPAGIPPSEDPERDLKDFSSYVFTDAQQTWQETFRGDGREYENAQLVLYRSAVDTACGSASSAVGPFYCPGDERVYLDLSFYGDMERQLGAGGDFAWAYVIGHEVGHHVQQELGTSDEVRRLQREDAGQANSLSVRLELQADCYAGVWANTVYAQGDLERGDVGEAVAASEAVGDDRLQRRAAGSVDPDSFTHGSSDQRRRWFEEGYRSGDAGACDTFSADEV
jgi:predicted metalloprotease